MTKPTLRRIVKQFMRRPRRGVKRWAAPLRRLLRPPDYGDALKRIGQIEDNLRDLLWAQHAAVSLDTAQRSVLRRSEFRVFSQNGEDGLLLHLFSRIGVTNGRFIEFGIGNPKKCNTANLALSFGWSGLLLDSHPAAVEAARLFYRQRSRIDPARVRVAQSLLTPENIDAVLPQNGMEGEIDLLSIDIDGNDYWVWKAIRAVSPRVVVIEYNASLGLDEPLVVVYSEVFDRYANHRFGWYHGASLPALVSLGRAKGYVLVGCESVGYNAFFVREDVAKGRLEELTAREAYYANEARLGVMSSEEQLASLRGLDLVRV